MTTISNFEQLGYTSDHVRIDIKAKINGLIWRGFTWNLQCYCLSKKDHPLKFSNNPFNCTETQYQYERRKMQQIDEIISLCTKMEYDFGFLQEVDFCFSNLSNKEKTIPWLTGSFNKLRNYFAEELERINYQFITYSDKELVTIYNTKRLTYLLRRSMLPYRDTNRLFVCVFGDNNSGNIITLGNIHGDYNADYSESIPSLLDKFRKDKSCLIIGGDMNHPPGYNTSRLLVPNENDPTNFLTNYSKAKRKFVEVQLNDSRCNLAKAYDGFFVSYGYVEILGSHVWSKQTNEHGDQYPILVNKTSIRKLETR